ncbi:DUF3108 domain-containing protein [Methylophilus aquaticus]|uniref:DUF3108 domain-containing protein n=1 Tax=Methylophilus aquaticus TaxID=1971610 RepID=A0ABT9JPL0_9PROT|nr:DUF3108 domain-containing protein [Methylophilus aquaticus]MDP8566505.1 DUF3108 domain-containing protein [Methylophilus aquaticus]
MHLLRLQWVAVIMLTAVGLLLALSAHAAPKQLTIEYDLLQQGVKVGTVHDALAVSGNQYKITSLTEGVGIYKLMGERTLSSQGQVVGNALRPGHFESLQSSHPNKSLISDFDWSKKTLNMQVKGEQASVPLGKSAQDLLSVMYAWMWQPPKIGQITLSVANGKKLTPRKFIITEEKTPMQTEAGRFNVIKLADSDGEKILYLAKDKGYLPVKLVVIDDHKRMEQVITRVTGQ